MPKTITRIVRDFRKVLTVNEVADTLGLAPNEVQKILRAGKAKRPMVTLSASPAEYAHHLEKARAKRRRVQKGNAL